MWNYIKSGIVYISAYTLAGVLLGRSEHIYPIGLLFWGVIVGLLGWALSALTQRDAWDLR